MLSMVQIKTQSLCKHRYSSSDWNYSADCRNANSLMIENEVGSCDGKLFHSPGRNFWAQLWVGSNKIFGGSELWPRLPPSLAQGSLPPFHFPGRRGHNGLTGTDRSQVLSPGLGHTDTNTLYQRSGLDLRITHSESDFTWTWSVVICNLE